MTSDIPSPTNRTYLISITAPQSVSNVCSVFQNLLRGYGLTDAPFPPGIPILQTVEDPGPPVPGLLPACSEPLVLNGELSTGDWITWPVKSSGWLGNLRKALKEHAGSVSVSDTETKLFTPLSGIPLARNSGEDGFQDLRSTEVSNILKDIPGWRALNLVCWDIEYLASRPWYQSVSWYPLWRRRLKRAPLKTNINKHANLD